MNLTEFYKKNSKEMDELKTNMIALAKLAISEFDWSKGKLEWFVVYDYPEKSKCSEEPYVFITEEGFDEIIKFHYEKRPISPDPEVWVKRISKSLKSLFPILQHEGVIADYKKTWNDEIIVGLYF